MPFQVRQWQSDDDPMTVADTQKKVTALDAGKKNYLQVC